MSETQLSGLPRPVITEDECKGCGRCVNACPKKALRMSTKINKKGFIHAEYSERDALAVTSVTIIAPNRMPSRSIREKKVTK